MKNNKWAPLILKLSEDLVKAQKPIRILNAIKWDDEIEQFFLKNKFQKIPPMGAAFYAKNPLDFDPEKKIEEFRFIRSEVLKHLGQTHPAARMLIKNCEEYQDVVHMLTHRGTPDFYRYSAKLFGSSKDAFSDGRTSVRELGRLMDQILGPLLKSHVGTHHPKDIAADKVVEELTKRLTPYFGATNVKVKLNDGILSDASAGSDYIKIKKGAMFSSRDIDIFEVHEGHVHVGTTLNGESQTYAKWLAKGPPHTMATQEGLATLMEIFSFVSLPQRAQRINDRLLAIEMSEDGATILDVIRFYLERGQKETEALKNAQRTFRGGVLEGRAPFTKDISYGKGFVMVYNFLRSSIGVGRPEMIPFLFCGKINIEDIPDLYQLHLEGLVDRPKYLPRHFADMNALAVWMAYSNFLNRMGLETIKNKMERSSAA